MMVGSDSYADPDDVADVVYSLWDTLADGETMVLTVSSRLSSSTLWGRKQPTWIAPPSVFSTASNVLGIAAGRGGFPETMVLTKWGGRKQGAAR